MSNNDESDDENNEDSDGHDDSVSSPFNKEKITSEIRDSMIKLIEVSGDINVKMVNKRFRRGVMIIVVLSCW